MGKKKKKNPRQLSAPSTSSAPALAPPLAPRTVAVLSVALVAAILGLLWLIQFYGVLTGTANLWEDVALQEYPYRVFARMALYGGEFPHWNPFTFGGMPFFATGSGVLYPPYTLISLLPLSDAATWWLLQTVIVTHILIAGLCMFAYMRFKEYTYTAALFGAIAFMFGGYMVTRVIHPGIIPIVAWMPLMLILLERGIRKLNPRAAVTGGLLLGIVMLAGHAQVMFYALMFMLTWGVYYIIKTDESPVVPAQKTPAPAPKRSFLPPKELLLKRTAVTAVFFTIAAGLCLVNYLPIFEASGQTARINYTLDNASQGSLQFVQLLTALMPKLFGAYTGSGNVPAFWLQDAFEHGYYNYWETSFYFGVSTLILSIFIFRKIRTDRSVMFSAGWILLSFLIALGGNFFFYKLLFALGIPGFNSFRHTPRILFIWGFLFPLMAAAALDSLNDLKTKKWKTVTLALCAAAALFGVFTAAGELTTLFPYMNAVPGRAEFAVRQGFILFVNALLLGGVLILFFYDKIHLNTAKLMIVACLALDMLVFAAGQHITNREGAHMTFRTAQARVEHIKNMRQDEIFRVNTRRFIVEPQSALGRQTAFMVMDRNQGYVSGIETLEGYNPFRLKYASLPLHGENFDRMLDLKNVKLYINPHAHEGGDRVMVNETRLPRAKLFYRANVVDIVGVVDVDEQDSMIIDYMNSRRYDQRSEVVVTDPRFERFTGGEGAGEVRITKYRNNRIELDVNTDREAILWLSEIWYPAWKATVNGERTEVFRANHSFRAVIVPPGASKVVFKFDSAMFNAGALVSLLTLIAALAYLLAGRFAKKRVMAGA
jgi:hypothetical protein